MSVYLPYIGGPYETAVQTCGVWITCRIQF